VTLAAGQITAGTPPWPVCRLRQLPDWDPVGYASDTDRRCRRRRRQVDDPVDGV